MCLAGFCAVCFSHLFVRAEILFRVGPGVVGEAEERENGWYYLSTIRMRICCNLICQKIKIKMAAAALLFLLVCCCYFRFLPMKSLA